MSPYTKTETAVILAAGRSTRTLPLTLNLPKPMLKVAGMPIIEHNIRALADAGIRNIIVVVGYKKDVLLSFLAGLKDRLSLSIKTVFQEEQNGTARALLLAKESVSEDYFIVIMGDDLYFKEDIEALIKAGPSILGRERKDFSSFGVISEEGGVLSGIVEKPRRMQKGVAVVNTGAYLLPSSVFGFDVHLSERREFELTEMVIRINKQQPLRVVPSNGWIPIVYPWSLLEANREILSRLRGVNKGRVEENAVIRGEVIIGRGSLIRAGAYIEGPVFIGEECDIGPNCYIRPFTSIGDRCRVGNASEVKESVIGDDVKIGHLSYVGDSVIADDVNFGAGTLIANLRHDSGNVRSMVKGVLIDTGRRKLGAIIGGGVRLGINTLIYPGRKLWPFTSTLPGEQVRKDKE